MVVMMMMKMGRLLLFLFLVVVLVVVVLVVVVALMLESNLLEFVVWLVAYPESSMRDLVRWPCSPARDGCGYR